MKNNAMSLKAVVNNIAKENKISAQSVLQTYMLERLLERISVSQYKENFVLKGGMLISAILGIDSRTTMDMDATLKGLELSEDRLLSILNDIIAIDLNDGVEFKIKHIEKIRDNDDYGGFRVSFDATYDGMPVFLKIDVTTGDKITYKEVDYSFKLLLEDRRIEVLSYNLETVIAEKFEAIIKRGVLSTRIRDFYDIHQLIHTQINNINFKLLRIAIIETSTHRGSLDIINQWRDVVELLRDDINMQQQWKRYKHDNFYAEGIEYKDLIEALIKVGTLYEENA